MEKCPALAARLGPALDCLPPEIEYDELLAYRLDYQAFRAGQAAGARGEIRLLALTPEVAQQQVPMPERQPYREERRRHSFVETKGVNRQASLMKLRLASSEASISALNAAIKHRDERAAGDGVARVLEKGDSFQDPTVVEPNSAPVAAAWPAQRNPQPGPHIYSMQGVGLPVHIIISFSCLLPCLLPGPSGIARCICLPAMYAVWVLARLYRNKASTSDKALAGILRMDRVVQEGCIPSWFPRLCAASYLLVALQLTLGRLLGTEEDEGYQRTFALWSQKTQRHSYSCWGEGEIDVADCILVRHAACTMLVTLYTCLLGIAACNRNIKGKEMVLRHRESLLEIFPDEAQSLFEYIERSVSSNQVRWKSNLRHKALAILMSLAWTYISFIYYAALLYSTRLYTARIVFIAAVPCTYVLQLTLLRHVMFRVLLYLETIKARAAALAYCDEEGVLPFTSARAVYVWFSVRRNAQAQNETAYHQAVPIFAGSLFVSVFGSYWAASLLWRHGLSLLALTSRGGASLMAVAGVIVSDCFVAAFLSTLLDIGDLEEAHAQQLRAAGLWLEHASWAARLCGGVSGGAPAGHSDSVDGDQAKTSTAHDVAHELMKMEGAAGMIEKVTSLIENHEAKPTVLGVEIGSKSFKGAFAAMLAAGWYLLVWGLLIPLMTALSAT